MDYFQLLLLAHILGDFTFQTDSIYSLKQKSPWGVPIHVLICSLANAAVLHPLLSYAAVWLAIAFIAVIHIALDRTKLFLTVFREKDGLGYFFIDQALHLMSLLGAAWYLQKSLPQATFWLSRGLAVTLTALNMAAFAAPPIIFYIHRAIAKPADHLKSYHFPGFLHRLPGVVSRFLATLGLILGGWHNLLVLTLLSAFILPLPGPSRNKRYLRSELAVSCAITLFSALIAWYVRQS
jgi:hypothetical protein